MFPGIVKMRREANTSKNDELFIKNKFNRSDVTNMTSDIDSNFCYRNWFFTYDNIDFEIIEPNKRKVTLKSYADNFTK